MQIDNEKYSQADGSIVVHLRAIEQRCLSGDPTLKDIFDSFGTDGHNLLLLFLIVPFLQPIPLLGLSTPFGVLIAVVAVLAHLKKPPYLPQKWASKKVSAATVKRIAEGCEKIFLKLEYVLHPRLKILFSPPFSYINTGVIVLNAALLALPLPIPFSNMVPGWVILFHTLGRLEDDGLFIVISYLQALFCLAYFVAIAKGVHVGLDMLQ